jgi:hypothetical protein
MLKPMLLRPVLAAAGAAASLGPGGPAAAPPVTRTALPAACVRWDGGGVMAMACDPDFKARGIRLHLGRETATGEHGLARVFGGEPLQPGETVTLRWRGASKGAVLVLKAGAPEGPRRVIVDLRTRPSRVDVTAQADGSLLVRTPGRTATVAPPPPYDVAWAPRSARAAATQLLAAVDDLEGDTRSLRTVCAAMDRDVFASYDLELGDPRHHPCWVSLAIHTFGLENVPTAIATRHHGLALAVHGGRAVLATRLVHRFRPYSRFDPTRVELKARVLLVRDGAGVWRLATVDPLLPLVAVEQHHAFTDAELAREYRRDAASGRRRAAREARADAARQADAVDGSGPAPCSAPLTADPAGDVSITDSANHARIQAAHGDVDLTGAGIAGGCVAITAAGALPASFDVELYDDRGRRLDVEVAAGRVVVVRPPGDDDRDPTPQPVSGIAAHLDPNGLVVAVPPELSGAVSFTLSADRDHERYFDEATAKVG